MKISVSNIAWDESHDREMYAWLRDNGIEGLEIAPSRLFGSKPYEHIREAADFSEELIQLFGIRLSSMQSILYGINENLFASDDDRSFLIDYLEQACRFAEAVKCGNLVFGCPRNRVRNGRPYEDGTAFFKKAAAIAYSHETSMAIEANPPIYNTDYINRTEQAFTLCDEVAVPGMSVNFDMGTVIFNEEDLSVLDGNITKISHVHVSESHLAPVEEREIHRELAGILAYNEYDRFVSVEMKNTGSLDGVKRAVKYVQEVFG